MYFAAIDIAVLKLLAAILGVIYFVGLLAVYLKLKNNSFRMSLRMFFVVVIAVALPLGWFGSQWHRARRMETARSEVERLSGEFIQTDYGTVFEVDLDNANITATDLERIAPLLRGLPNLSVRVPEHVLGEAGAERLRRLSSAFAVYRVKPDGSQPDETAQRRPQ